ncbi:MAG: hypothetical protein EZS28_030510 [Streblomastix strix]|uniref:Uncharacterized protein n=1 Tax=Streblomastix strix TaxID=222440 RepID=A0A5J4UUE3_9EUKA|nr:MAG: hypothetical protein EZS28_030510 [Streblomastix strix]
MKQMFDDGFYAIAIILSQQNNKHFYTPSPYFSIICHPEKIQYITNDTTVPELTSIKYRLNVDESIFLHPIVQEKCIGKKDMHYITCPKKCDNMKDLCVLAQGIKIGELKYLNKEIIQKTLLRIGPIQLINSELGGYNFKKGIVIYGWNEHIDKLTNKSHEYWNIAYHDSFSQKIETKYHNSILTDQNLSAEKIIAYKVIGKPNLKTCIREDLEVIKLNIKNYIIDLLQESIPWIGLVITLSFAVWFYKIGNTKLKLKQKRKREYEIQRLQKEWGKQQKFDIRRQLKKKEQEQYKTPKPEIPIHYTPEQLLQRKLQAEYKEKEQLRINAEQEKDRRRNEEEKRRRDEEERRRDKEEKLQKEYEYNKEMEELNSYYNSKQDDIRKQYHINSYSYEENRSREESDLNQLNRTYDNCYHDINHKYDKDICIIQ